ncbi:MAG: carboxypeptidase-like regulatory domain-containing protein [Gemmatimonadota bacterium]|nr:carboxypeptidase-like regulatory domain-containing protein [Gemmatimonadota bacterium]
MTPRVVTRHVLGLCLFALVAPGPAPVAAQTILGRVLDQDSERPIGGVIVSLVEADGSERARALADSLGRFQIGPPEAGEYLVVAERFGYFETRSPLIALGMEGEASLELMMIPEPIGLEGLEVSVEERASQELQQLGLTPSRLGNRWIDKTRIEEIPVKIDMGAILERTAQASLRVIRPENLTLGSDPIGLCISLQRARTGDGRGTCSLIVLNGVPISGEGALDIDPNAIESIAILEPIEASTFYGTAGGSGAVLVWTRRAP